MNRLTILNNPLLTYQHATDKTDLASLTLTHDNLTLILGSLIAAKIRTIVTAVRSDHGPDPAGSVHGHAEGWALDFAPVDDKDAAKMLHVLCYNSPHTTKVGLGGAYANLVNWNGQDVIDMNNTVVFRDNNSLHFHAQSA